MVVYGSNGEYDCADGVRLGGVVFVDGTSFGLLEPH